VNEEALRSLVRETIVRLDTRSAHSSVPDAAPLAPSAAHPSNYRYHLTPTDGPCLIEPAVPCNHCGYCQTHGH
jgi:hypothetical protein